MAHSDPLPLVILEQVMLKSSYSQKKKKKVEGLFISPLDISQKFKKLNNVNKRKEKISLELHSAYIYQESA